MQGSIQDGGGAKLTIVSAALSERVRSAFHADLTIVKPPSPSSSALYSAVTTALLLSSRRNFGDRNDIFRPRQVIQYDHRAKQGERAKEGNNVATHDHAQRLMTMRSLKLDSRCSGLFGLEKYLRM
jgi:hypothetical protein